MLYFSVLYLLLHGWTLLFAIPEAMCYCPSRCRCNEEKLLVFCNSTQIDLVPIMLNPQLKELYLSQNRVKNVYSSFTVYQDLRYLDLSYNLITDIGKRSFIMQKNLRVLLLNSNNLTQINNLSFHGLNSLHLLNLNHNQLSELHSRIFMALNRLEMLDMSFNQISFIHKETFFGLLNLRQLNLHGNKLKQIPTHCFFHLQSLVRLNLGQNYVTHVPEMAFSPLGSLQELRLDSCYISLINERAFVHLHNLTYMDLQNNKLLHVPSDSFKHLPNLQVLILSHNLIGALRSTSFRGLLMLHTLVVSFSPLSYIDREAFLFNPRLSRVVMENNRQLERILPGTFASQSTSLKHLSLRADNIAVMEAGTINLDRVQHLDLEENPIVCNCSLSWLVDYLRSVNGSSPLGQQVKCHQPASQTDKTLITLTRADLACPRVNSSLELWLNIVTGTVLASLVVLLVLLCRRHRPKCCPCQRDSSRERHHHPPAQHMIVATGERSKSRLNQCLYYPPIINEEFTREKYYHTMTTSTRTSALSVDLHRPPLQYVPIVHI